MDLAIMQPYFFPYIGYWQLIHAVDRFVVYDDVNYVKRGWINRNRLLINGKATYITVPLHETSQHKRICEIALHASPAWRDKLVRTVDFTYRRAPYFGDVFPVIEALFRHKADTLRDYLLHQLQTLAAFLGITTQFVPTSRCYANHDLAGQERILDICRRERATRYVNLAGGHDLYETRAFRDSAIDLHFLCTRLVAYKQRSPGFVPGLSIIDLLMEVGPHGVKQHLQAFDLRRLGELARPAAPS